MIYEAVVELGQQNPTEDQLAGLERELTERGVTMPTLGTSNHGYLVVVLPIEANKLWDAVDEAMGIVTEAAHAVRLAHEPVHFEITEDGEFLRRVKAINAERVASAGCEAASPA